MRNDTIQGLLALLQEGGHAVEGGWAIVFELLKAVPASLAPAASTALLRSVSHNEEGLSSSATAVNASSGFSDEAWPKEALLTAFSCMKLIVDDFLELLPHEVIIQAVHCVSAFSAQSQDINISLTSIEMLWKVADYIMTSSRKQGDEATTTAALDVMLGRLSLLSVDSRPEIRNCSTNTLFSAVMSNATMLTAAQWKSVFEDIIFPLFEATEQKSVLAMASNEEAMTPEIKKGVRMAVHHSRDTAHKQVSDRAKCCAGCCCIAVIMRLCFSGWRPEC